MQADEQQIYSDNIGNDMDVSLASDCDNFSFSSIALMFKSVYYCKYIAFYH